MQNLKHLTDLELKQLYQEAIDFDDEGILHLESKIQLIAYELFGGGFTIHLDQTTALIFRELASRYIDSSKSWYVVNGDELYHGPFYSREVAIAQLHRILSIVADLSFQGQIVNLEGIELNVDLRDSMEAGKLTKMLVDRKSKK